MSAAPEKTIFDIDIEEKLEDTTRINIQRPILVMLDGAEMNHRFEINKAEVIIGRDMMADIAINDTRASRRHVKVEFVNMNRAGEEPQIYVEDLKSTNGTYLNGNRLTGRQLLKDRDKVLIGATLFGYSVRNQNEVQADQKLLELATLDALTGLNNRGMFNREVVKEFDRARRYKRELSFVLFDIDHFKKFNDTYGHQMGDHVLKEMGRLVRLNQRSNDICARYGGEEFAVILPETPLDGALINAERMRLSVMNNVFKHDETKCQVTISIGITTQEASMNSADDLIRLADRALYQAKADGRNCIWVAKDNNFSKANPRVTQC